MPDDNLKTKRILSYEDVVLYKAGDSSEPLVDVRTYDSSIIATYIKYDMIPYTGNIIYVRDSLAHILATANNNLRQTGYRLKVVYGYRHPEIQIKYFTKRRLEVKNQFPNLNDRQLDSYTHNFVAKPDIAGHPTGAAIDLTLVHLNGASVDMGGEIADYAVPERIVTSAKDLTAAQAANRWILHDALISQGVAPFYGEWWHFSYGDREWAAFYNKKALYGLIDLNIQG